MSVILDMAKQKECKPGRYTEMRRLPREMKSEQDWLFAWRCHHMAVTLCSVTRYSA